jgi:hypothetical protein
VLAEIAVANAAFSVIKQALTNGKELFDVADSATSYFDSKSVIAKKAKQGGNRNELQAFMELQKLKKQEEWLREHMIYAGDPGMWNAWLQFQSDAKKLREKEAALARYEKQQNKKFILMWAKGLGISILFIPLLIFMIMALIG